MRAPSYCALVEMLMTSKNERDEYFAAFALFNGTDILEGRDELVPTDFNNNTQRQPSCESKIHLQRRIIFLKEK